MSAVYWPCRVVTPQATYEPAHLRFERGLLAEVVDKAGQTIETMDTPALRLVAEGPAAAAFRYDVTQRWEIEGPGESRWLCDVLKSCGCGSTRVTGSNLSELAW